MSWGRFDDLNDACVITEPLLPRPWINYLTNRRLTAFISHNAGGRLWLRDPQTRSISRYHYLAAPGDRPGFYVYVHDRSTGTLWNPHAAPTMARLDEFAARHEPGVTTVCGRRDDVSVDVSYFIPPDDDAMIWRVSVKNHGPRPADLSLTSYLEFGLLQFLRELYWCYLQTHVSFTWDADLRAIRYDYHVFEAPQSPRMLFASTADVVGFDCSRDAFVGRGGSLAQPAALVAGGRPGNTELPTGGHGCAALSVDATLKPGDHTTFAYLFTIGDTWADAQGMLDRLRHPGAIDAALEATRTWWARSRAIFQITCDDRTISRFINTWNPTNCLITAQLCRSISTDHVGTDGLRFRDTAQDAQAVAHLEPDYARDRLRRVLSVQSADGDGCFNFFPDVDQPPGLSPHRSDNPVWPVYTTYALVCETGDLSLLDESISFRDDDQPAGVWNHLMRGLRLIHSRRGRHGLPVVLDADWNDGLALFGDRGAESVMLGMQVVLACQQMGELARASGRGDGEDAAWLTAVADELTDLLNREPIWDGRWYSRLILSDGYVVGSAQRRQGRIFLNPQAWSILSGVGDRDERGRTAMDAAAEFLDTRYGLRVHAPPYRGFPEPDDPPLGSTPGTNENGAIFCHANTWAIIAEAILRRPDRAWKYYRQMLPQVVLEQAGLERYQREPYALVSTIAGPDSPRFGQGGISWLSGTASWLYIAATQHLLGIRPTLQGLEVDPCLPPSQDAIRIQRRFRGCDYDITLQAGDRDVAVAESGLTVDGRPHSGSTLRPTPGQQHTVIARVC